MQRQTLEEQKQNAAKLAVGLMCGFAWSETQEGLDYWIDVHLALERISKKGK